MITGKNRIENTFARLRESGEKGLITYVTAGYPDARHTLEIAMVLADSGSDLIEIGIPFSDPIADGPVIQQASHQALAGGIKQADIFNITEKLRKYTDIPVLLMTYYNPVLRAGLGNFTGHARDSGIDGLIVPDLPVEEDDELRFETTVAGLSLVPLAAPTSTNSRLKKIAAKADGFIYCVSVTGVTGSREAINTDLKSFVRRVKNTTDRPLAVGFGVSGPEMASRVAAGFDAVVVGSAVVRAIEGNGGLPGVLKRVGGLTRAIKDALIQGGAAR
ncbi:MAG: tryptophan synthase subunit alpha [Bacillota bacterium]